MALLLDSPIGSLLGKSDAEKALQPWWEMVEDYLVYGLIGLGEYFGCFFCTSDIF